MLYMKSSETGLVIVVLETENLDELRKGRPAKTPDGSILIAWTPDPEWLAQRIIEAKGDGLAIGRAIDEAAKRPQQPLRAHHEAVHFKHGG